MNVRRVGTGGGLNPSIASSTEAACYKQVGTVRTLYELDKLWSWLLPKAEIRAMLGAKHGIVNNELQL